MSEVRANQLEKIHALTSLRFFAALFVVLFHTLFEFYPALSRGSVVGRLFSNGFTSVSFFFLLSGYILAIVYLRRGTKISRTSFFRARFARIYPLFFATLVLDTPFLLSARIVKYGLKSALIKTAVTFLSNCVMLQAWSGDLRGIDNPNWSLSVETLFYLSFPWLGVALWKLHGKNLWLTAAALYFGGQALVYWNETGFGPGLSHCFPLLHLSTFALGILMARWQVDMQDSKRQLSSPGSSNARPELIGSYIAITFAIVAFAAVLYWTPVIPEDSLYAGLLAPVFVAVIYAFSHGRWRPARLLSAPWLIVLGEASFGLYLIHIVVLHGFIVLHLVLNRGLYPVYLLACVVASVLSFYYFETPVRRWLLRTRPVHVKETLEMSSDAQ